MTFMAKELLTIIKKAVQSASKMKQERTSCSQTDTDVMLSVKLDLSVSIERVIKFIPKNQSTYCLFSVGVM